MEEINKELSDQDQNEQSQDQNDGTVETEEAVGGAAKPETVNVLGRDYDLSNPDQVQELVKDYDRLGRMYSPLTQQYAELERTVKSLNEKPQADFADPETVEYLRKLGFVHREEQIQKEEDRELESMIQGLEKNFDGKDGRPKFDRRTVLEFCVQNGIANPEYGYKLMNYDNIKAWELRQAKSAPKAPPSLGGEGGPREPQPKRRVFGPVEEGQVSLRDAILETLEHGTPTSNA